MLRECCPFTYLAQKYTDDVAVGWINAHSDITLPYDDAMALTVFIGMRGEEIMSILPAKFSPTQALVVGLRSWDPGMKERQQNLGIVCLSPLEVAKNSTAVLTWLKNTGASKVVINFDLDVLEPAEIIAGVGVVPNGMKIQEVIRVINDIATMM